MSYEIGKSWVYAQEQENCVPMPSRREESKGLTDQHHLLVDKLLALELIRKDHVDYALKWREEFERAGLSSLSASSLLNDKIDTNIMDAAEIYRCEKPYKNWRRTYHALKDSRVQSILLDLCCYDILPQKLRLTKSYLRNMFDQLKQTMES